MNAPDVFRRVLHALDAAGIPYMLTGSSRALTTRLRGRRRTVIAADRVQIAELARAFSAPSYYCCDAGELLVRSSRSRSST